MAVADFGGKVLGKPIEVVYADHQNKADIAASKAREWMDAAGSTCWSAARTPRPRCR
jgi:branched-chain amino acid transport system substrate-binding protein